MAVLKLEQTPTLTVASVDAFVGIADSGCFESYGKDFRTSEMYLHSSSTTKTNLLFLF